MIECSKCQHQNPNDAIFCNRCGQKMEIECDRCGKANPPGSKFCNQCGNPFSDPSAARGIKGAFRPSQPLQTKPEPESLGKGERRQITTVFSDLSGYTSLNERLDPEEVEAIMSRIKKEAAGIVERLEGIVNQYVGDEVLALFGVPFAHEDDPVRAVRAALDIHRMVRRISLEVESRTRTELRMHTGISTGLIVTQMQDTREGSYGITGDTVNVGARLASHAETDQILVDPATYQLVAPYFETKALKPVNVAGKSKSLIPHLVTGQSAVQTRFEASRLRGFTSFTGREHELTTLYSCLENMLSGKGQFVTVAGEAGLGKSRLIYEFRHSLNRAEITVLQGRCQSYGTSIPYFPHINALRRGLNLRDDDTPSELHQKAVSNILEIDTSLEQYLPILLHLLSIPSKEYPLSKNLHDQELARAILEALTAVYILNTKNHPMVLIFEDWHWADEASDVALKYMHSLIASYPMMILVIFRPDYPANWGNWSHHTPIVLNALDYFNCEKIIKSVWDADHLPEGIVPLIHERTGGNPFFVEEISSALVEEDTVRLNDRWAVLNKPLEKVSIPNTVQAVIRARLDRLDDYTHESLRLASVIGREFTRRVLEKISTSREQLTQALERLKALELIQQTKLVPEAEYMFKHVITQEVTYETLLKQKRKDLHRLVGQAIEELYRDRLEEFYETLAFHFWRGQDWQRAYQYNREAGLKAQSFSAYIEAQNFLEVALEALQKLPRTTDNLEREIDLRFNMRSALFPQGKHDDWADHIRVAESLAEEIHDETRLASIYNYLAGYLWIRGRHKESIELGEKGLRLSKSTGNFDAEVTTKVHIGIPLLYTGEIKRQIALHREVAKQLSGPAALERYGFSSVPSITARSYLAFGLSELGEFEEAEMWARQGIELSGQVKNLFSTALIHACSGLAYLRQGKIDTAFKLLQEGYALSSDADIRALISLAAGSLGHCYLLMERPGDALPILNNAVDPQILEASIFPSIYPITVLAETYRLMGQTDKACETAEEALRIFRQTDERCFGAWALYEMAIIQSENNSKQIEEAPHTYQLAIDLAEELNMKPLQAHCHLKFGQHYAKIEKTDLARSEFLNAIDLYRSLGMAFWLPMAEARFSEIDEETSSKA